MSGIQVAAERTLKYVGFDGSQNLPPMPISGNYQNITISIAIC
jgi:hypothetical protein